jgi:uncharacterized protein YjiS (DUF1127 family)
MLVTNWIISLWQAIADWRRRERAYAELMALDDHSLADIGIRRSQIRAVCEGSYRPDQPAADTPSPRLAILISP